MDKVIHGTPKGSESLCATCRRAHKIVGINLQMIVVCTAIEKALYFPVSECSLYDDKRLPSLYDMEKIAWHVHSRNRGPVGFAGRKPPSLDIVITPPRRGGDNDVTEDPSPQQPGAKGGAT